MTQTPTTNNRNHPETYQKRCCLPSMLRFWKAWQWPLLGVAWVFSLALGYFGFQQYYQLNNDPQPLLTYLYLSAQLFVLNSGGVPGVIPPALDVARFMAPVVAAYTAVQALAMFFSQQFQMFYLRLLMHDHVIICGLGEKGCLLVSRFIEKGRKVVVIERDSQNNFLEAARESGATVLLGDAAKPEMLLLAAVQRARYLVAVNGEDATNAEIAARARQICRSRQGEPLTCIVHIQDPKLCDLLHEREIGVGEVSTFRLEFFNVFDLGARAVLDQYNPFQTQQETTSAKPPHIVIVGLGSMGRSLMVRAARRWRDRQNLECQKLRITVVDREANQKVETLLLRFPKLTSLCDITPVQTDIQWAEFHRAKFLYDAGGNLDVSIVYICLDNDSLGLSASLTLNQHLHQSRTLIVVRTSNEMGIGGLLCASDALYRSNDALYRSVDSGEDGYCNLRAFGLLERTCKPDLLLRGVHEIVAQAIHEDYVRRQTEQGETYPANPSLLPWDELSEEIRDKNRRQADQVGIRLRECGYGIRPLTDWDMENVRFTEEEITAMAQKEHDRYRQTMFADGWTLGQRNAQKKTNPNLVPWEELSPESIKLTRGPFYKLPRLLAEAGLEVYRTD